MVRLNEVSHAIQQIDMDGAMIGISRQWYEEAKEKLRQYELTNLSPEQVAELAKAQEEGRLVVYPVKSGDVVYFVNVDEEIISGKVDDFTYSSGDIAFNVKFHVCGMQYGLPLRESIGVDHDTWFDKNDLGKTVFLTREEAEAVLAAREDGVDECHNEA